MRQQQLNANCPITKNQSLVMPLILLLAAILRTYHIQHFDLWFDEMATEMFSAPFLSGLSRLTTVSIPDLILSKIPHETHSSLYYICIYFYSALFGDGTSLRFLSLAFSLLSLPLFYRLARLFFDKKTSLSALFLLAINPFHIWYAQEARAYAMATFFSILMVYIFLKAIKTGKILYWLFFPVTCVLSILSIYSASLIMLLLGGVLLPPKCHKYFPRWILSVSIVSLLILLIHQPMTQQIDFVKDHFWLSAPDKIQLLFTWFVFTLGYTATLYHYIVGLILFVALFLRGAFVYCEKNEINTYIITGLLFLPITIIYILSHEFTPLYINRQLIIFSPFLYLLVANGLTSIKHKNLQYALWATIIVLTASSLINFYQGRLYPGENAYTNVGYVFPKKHYQAALNEMTQKWKSTDLIVTSEMQAYSIALIHLVKNHNTTNCPPLTNLQFAFYPERTSPYFLRFLNLTPVLENVKLVPQHEPLSLSLPSYLIKKEPTLSLFQEKAQEHTRIWFITSTFFPEKSEKKIDTLDMNTRAVRKTIESLYQKTDTLKNDGVFLELYEKRL